MLTRSLFCLTVVIATGLTLASADSHGTCTKESGEFQVTLEDLKDEKKHAELRKFIREHLSKIDGDIIDIKTTILANDITGNEVTLHPTTATSEDDISLGTGTTERGLTTNIKVDEARLDVPCEHNVANMTCFWIWISRSANMTYVEAEQKCNETGASLALITNEEVFNKVIDGLLSMNKTKIRVWIGHTFDPLRNATTHPSRGAFEKWMKRQPAVNATTDGNKTAVYLVVKSDNKSDNGMANQERGRKRDGVVCQYIVP